MNSREKGRGVNLYDDSCGEEILVSFFLLTFAELRVSDARFFTVREKQDQTDKKYSKNKCYGLE